MDLIEHFSKETEKLLESLPVREPIHPRAYDFANTYQEYLEAAGDDGDMLLIMADRLIRNHDSVLYQHKQVIAELVRELEGVEGWAELMRMAIVADETRTDLTKRVNLLIKDTQRAIARAKELEVL